MVSRKFRVRRAIGDEEHEIEAYIHFTGPPDSLYGDEKYRRIRVACQHATPHEPSSHATNATRQWHDAQTLATPTVYGQQTSAAYPHPSGPPDRQHTSFGGSWAQSP
ncbi:hypothetical protein PsorP6_012589 [Peronosclerospora sorghi]|uniref:Uncharacterized protein n=1 Tax=Peronosclerospora sorghi TaxID=230839 RepID=A0ACC0WK57_9STRA|nr:hypothetical protein PsorP6_012589 [Peronosclerospora sorghi]